MNKIVFFVTAVALCSVAGGNVISIPNKEPSKDHVDQLTAESLNFNHNSYNDHLKPSEYSEPESHYKYLIRHDGYQNYDYGPDEDVENLDYLPNEVSSGSWSYKRIIKFKQNERKLKEKYYNLIKNNVNKAEFVAPDDNYDYNVYLGRSNNPYIPTGLEATLDESSPNHWTHKEKNQWSHMFPTCAGTKQSPVALSKTVAKNIDSLACLKWANYHSFHTYLTLSNSGHSIEAGTTGTTGSTPILSGGPLNGTYALGGIHWHWGDKRNRGSEHTWDGRALPMEAHFVHYSTKFPSLQQAMQSGEPRALAVVGVGIRDSSFPIAGMSIITKAMRDAKGPGKQPTFLPLGHLGLNFQKGYYTYLGSLTTPPCTEGVVWIVLKEPITIRDSQLRVFRNVRVNGEPLVNNYRDVQPLNSRTVNFARSCH